MFDYHILLSKMGKRNFSPYFIFLLCVVNIYCDQVLADEKAVGAAQITDVNKNVDYPGNYEDVSYVFMNQILAC